MLFEVDMDRSRVLHAVELPNLGDETDSFPPSPSDPRIIYILDGLSKCKIS